MPLFRVKELPAARLRRQEYGQGAVLGGLDRFDGVHDHDEPDSGRHAHSFLRTSTTSRHCRSVSCLTNTLLAAPRLFAPGGVAPPRPYPFNITSSARLARHENPRARIEQGIRETGHYPTRRRG